MSRSSSRICSRVERVCPSPERIYELLREKTGYAARICHGVPRPGIRIDINEAARLSLRLYGKLQKPDLSEPPPPPHVIYEALANSTVALIACLHARYYCDRGVYHNEFLSITGPGGFGKSTYAIYVADLLGGVVFTREDDVLRGIMALIARQEWVPIIVLDDIAAIISKYWYLSAKERSWRNFFKMIEYLKDITGVMLTTARSFEGQAKRFRELSSYYGKVLRLYGSSYIVDIVIWKDTAYRSVCRFVDVLWPGLKLPQHIWERIMRLRKIRSQILVLESLLELASSREIPLPEDEIERVKARLRELREQLFTEQSQDLSNNGTEIFG